MTEKLLAWDEGWIASDKLSCDLRSGKVVGGISSDALLYGIRLGLRVHVHLTLCRLRVAITSEQGTLFFFVAVVILRQRKGGLAD